jgi:peptidoglycan glycosyltransferase
MNRGVRRLGIGLMVCYLALFVQLNILQVGRKDELDSNPLNNRQTIREFNRPRGPIITSDGTVVARSISTPDSEFAFQRQYPLGDLFSHITGYYTFSFGSTGLEKSQNDVLTGKGNTLGEIDDIFQNSDTSGSVVLTLRSDVQRVAADALGTRVGSVVVMDPINGAVLAMVSYPRFDPNFVVDPDPDVAEDVLQFYNDFPGNPLRAAAWRDRFMPGSSFKVVTTGIGFENGVLSLDSTFPVETEWTPPQTTDPIENYGGLPCGGTMTEVFYRSCNIPFAQTAVALGPDRMVDGTRAWGIGETVPIDLPGAVASNFEIEGGFEDNIPLLAIGGFGQGETSMVPLQMAMVASTVANGGRMMTPYAVGSTFDNDGNTLSRTQPSVWKTPISSLTAATLNGLMVEVVNQGTGRPMQLAPDPQGNPVQGAAKTGTAQLSTEGPEQSNLWIIGFAPAEAPRYAIAVMVRGEPGDELSQSTGGRVAGPIAKTVLDYLIANPTPPATAPAPTQPQP